MTVCTAPPDRDRALIRTLTCGARFLTTDQIERALFASTPDGRAQCIRQIYRLKDARLLRSRYLLMHRTLPLVAPLLTWTPGQPLPGPEVMEAASYWCKARWTGSPRATTVWCSTRKASALYGGFVGVDTIRIDQASHDLHMGELYVRFLLQQGETPDLTWVPEPLLIRQANERLPDALLLDGAGRPVHAIDFGGSAKRQRIEKLIEFGKRYEVSVELW